MNPLTPHTHNDVDSPKLYLGDAVLNAPQEAVTVISGSASGTYGATEQAMINDTKTAVNDLISKLQTLGILK